MNVVVGMAGEQTLAEVVSSVTPAAAAVAKEMAERGHCYEDLTEQQLRIPSLLVMEEEEEEEGKEEEMGGQAGPGSKVERCNPCSLN